MPDFLTKVPILFVFFVIFLLLFNWRLRKHTKAQKDVEESFWERERLANATRKQDISNLPYINIPLEIIPQNLHTASEEAIVALADQKILNLTGKTNTDLKMEYGVANLEILSACDDRFAELVKHLAQYSQELLSDNQVDAAQQILEFAVTIQADAKTIYLSLGQIYKDAGELSRIDELIAAAEGLQSLSKTAIVSALQDLKS